ncbi:ABC transporter permease [Hyphomicrobium sp.]|uniref:ABC transporter permease n=1 Tax=Hyphomicrobium sp. TaxID=82 RepID=UPI001D424A89|nr:ABC transporter permease [Hyphomicrobium sp.]MBY0558777.1 ABC transporter permease [Hyphomicrobium sp.]
MAFAVQIPPEQTTTTPEHLSRMEQDEDAPLRVFKFGAVLPRSTTLLLGIVGWGVLLAVWQLLAETGSMSSLVLPGPAAVVSALYRLFAERDFIGDVTASIVRVLESFLAACLVAVPLGIVMGAFRPIEALVNPIVAAWRYLPAPSFVPLLLMWFGTGDTQKLALLFLGVVWFLITLVMDYTKAVRTELVETALTLGGTSRQILWTVVVPAALPNIFIALRQVLAVSWTYLVIAEIVAATDGIGAMMMRASRFVRTDEVMAGILMIGLLGLVFDFLFACAQRFLFPYERGGT